MEGDQWEKLVLTLSESEADSQEINEEQAVSIALGHLSNTKRKIIRSTLFDGGSLVAWTLEDLGPADVPYRYSFQLKDYSPTSYLVEECPQTTTKLSRKRSRTCCGHQLLKECAARGSSQS